jgi:hypothetical protein
MFKKSKGFNARYGKQPKVQKPSREDKKAMSSGDVLEVDGKESGWNAFAKMDTKGKIGAVFGIIGVVIIMGTGVGVLVRRQHLLKEGRRHGLKDIYNSFRGKIPDMLPSVKA